MTLNILHPSNYFEDIVVCNLYIFMDFFIKVMSDYISTLVFQVVIIL